MSRRWLRRLRVPHPLVLLTGGILLAALASWVVTPGSYDREFDEGADREVVVAGTYREAPERSGVNAFDAVVAIPRGMLHVGDVIFLVFLIGGAFTVVDSAGVLGRGTAALARALSGRSVLIIPVVSLCFAAGGVTFNMQEEIIALAPVILILCRKVGFQPVVAAAMSLGAAMVGSAFSPTNPFQVGIAKRVADLDLGAASLFRSAVLAVALAVWIVFTMRYAIATRADPADVVDDGASDVPEAIRRSDIVVLGLVALTFVVITVGLMRYGWGFNELSAAFVIMGVAVGAIARMGLSGTAEAFVRGFREMAYAALLIGFARAIYLVLEDGQVLDTIVHATFTPLSGLPLFASAAGMTVAQAGLHVIVPSVSSQAVLTMPIAVPLADLLGMSREIVVLAYQYGGGLCDLMTPTNGALMAVLATVKVRYEEWFRFAGPAYLLLLGLGIVAIWVALETGVG